MKPFLLGICILVTLFFADVSSADACTLSSARWNVNFVRVGETIKAQVMSSGCSGYSFTVNVYEQDTVDNDTLRVNIPGQFQSSGAFGEVAFTLAEDDYARGGNESGNESIFFVAAANNQEVTSNVIGFERALVSPSPSPSGTISPTPSGSGRPITYTFKLDNPLGGASDLMGLIRAISQWIFNISIPVAVIFIIYGGLQFLLAGANPAMAAKGKQTLKYAVLGLAIVLIGYGFVTLIESIIKLGDGGASPSPTTSQRP